MEPRHFTDADLEQDVLVFADHGGNVGHALPELHQDAGFDGGAGEGDEGAGHGACIDGERGLAGPCAACALGGEEQGPAFGCAVEVAAKDAGLGLCTGGFEVGPGAEDCVNAGVGDGREALAGAAAEQFPKPRMGQAHHGKPRKSHLREGP